MRLIDADALKELFSEVIGRIAIKPEMNGNLEHMIRASAMVIQMIDDAPSAQPESCEDDPRADVYYLAEKIGIHQLYALVVQLRGEPEPCEDAVSRQVAIDALCKSECGWNNAECRHKDGTDFCVTCDNVKIIKSLPSAQPDLGKYEYHYDHTDCIWYRPEARNRCPVTCAQYRDGWNDAMNYIFRDGKGYRPYRRGEQYEE